MASTKRLEKDFQYQLKKDIQKMLPGSFVFKMDQQQGIPDLIVLHKDKWATLECKRSEKAKRQPNQEYYVGLMDEMSFSRFISPENKEEVLNELRRSFET